MFGQTETYQPPEWAAKLSYVPKRKIQLAMANTPIHPWKVPGVPEDFSVSVKRDDLTGCALSGNKVRKLEFLLADAIGQGCRHVITWGGLQSNHCRSVALCARQLGLTPHLFLLGDITDKKEAGCEGNVLLDRLCAAHIYLMNGASNEDALQATQQLAQNIQSTSGEPSYLIPVGGSNKTGLFGYVTVFEELTRQGVLEQFDDLVFPCGSGGTAAGLAVGNYLTGGHLRVHGICVSEDAAHFYKFLDTTLEELGLGHLRSRDLLRLVDGHLGRGYALSTDEELEFIQRVAAETSIVLDPSYNGKTTLGMVKEMRNNPSAFKGRRVLYIHTGGIFGLLDGRMRPVLERMEEQQFLIRMWRSAEEEGP
ncbi:uncharacterized protein LOC143275473 [Babylonia areolata]|uniref:uncharacterized protein LOC143275473 n=1 Tax=Babylonia areolata TaxID=304850 RepID=UPI003FD45C17